MIELDVRGFSCPIPVVKTKKAIDENPDEPITILVETVVSKENVERFVSSRGYKIREERVTSDEYRLLLIPDDK